MISFGFLILWFSMIFIVGYCTQTFSIQHNEMQNFANVYTNHRIQYKILRYKQYNTMLIS